MVGGGWVGGRVTVLLWTSLHSGGVQNVGLVIIVKDIEKTGIWISNHFISLWVISKWCKKC